MKVSDAVEKLLKLPQDLELWIDDNEYGPFQPGAINVRTINVKNQLNSNTKKWEREDREVALLE